MQTKPAIEVLTEGMYPRLFREGLALSPQLSEVYELALAFYESMILNEEEIVNNGAYFIRVADRLTRHYLICTGEPLLLPKHSSSRLRSFFTKNQFRTGYATHGLFPYRGKFHPQMIKALINIMGLKPGDTILDPMMGSGTVPIEACLMGIKSIAIDASPFCRFMAQTKYDALAIRQEPIASALDNGIALFELFSTNVGIPDSDNNIRNSFQTTKLRELRNTVDSVKLNMLSRLTELIGEVDDATFNFLLLAYLDSAGYAERSKRKQPVEQFQAILERYVFSVKKIQCVLKDSGFPPTAADIRRGDARRLELCDESVEGILFSPPYSFAIDYLANDSFHLNVLGENIERLAENMVGLRGKTLKEKYSYYIEDMVKILSECSRVLKPGRFCTIIIGTNDNQLSKVLDIPKEEVIGLNRRIIDWAQPFGFSHVRSLSRQISGISNTMRNEYIVILIKSLF